MSVRKQIAFVAQDDSLQVASTPRECIRFSAKLRLPRSTSEKELDHLTDRMIEELGLTKCADTMLGGPLLKGISGGERKRTSVGMELVVKPSLVFLDEPTSGLDSFSAIQLVNVLKKVSNAGASVLFTIHQPSSAVFGSFDQFLLLNRGKVMYQGAAGDLTVYLSEHRYAIPPHHNPADFVMNLAQTLSDAELEEAGLYLKDTRNLPLAERLRAVEVINVCTQRASKHSEVDERRVSMLTEINLLFIREVRNLVRFRQPLVARFGFSSFMSLLVGVIFFDVGTLSSDVPKFGFSSFMSLLVGVIFFDVGTLSSDVPKNFQSHFGAVMITQMQSMFSTAMPSLLAFPTERPVFLREYATNHYSVISYFVSRLMMEALVTLAQICVMTAITVNMISLQSNYFLYNLISFCLAMTSTALAVMLASLVENPKMATELLPLVIVPQMLLAGFFISSDLIPEFIRWTQVLCSLAYAIRLALLSEFGNCESAICTSYLASNDVNKDYAW
eukprot:CAMPEP_0195539598 /NCGR_PEP_ID=MMETSP0794_2-20130614/50136_1 /TAXON_ID=515487 /ORGANISM="Stephanopyxis turris, Strain CCMP 815" /LENGTH=501 /DNA_ID=CAMNT_0040673637 /DNA_START=420 /DNA_END=1922 /DNA_ORIENTATION=-